MKAYQVTSDDGELLGIVLASNRAEAKKKLKKIEENSDGYYDFNVSDQAFEEVSILK